METKDESTLSDEVDQQAVIVTGEAREEYEDMKQEISTEVQVSEANAKGVSEEDEVNEVKVVEEVKKEEDGNIKEDEAPMKDDTGYITEDEAAPDDKKEDKKEHEELVVLVEVKRSKEETINMPKDNKTNEVKSNFKGDAKSCRNKSKANGGAKKPPLVSSWPAGRRGGVHPSGWRVGDEVTALWPADGTWRRAVIHELCGAAVFVVCRGEELVHGATVPADHLHSALVPLDILNSREG